MKKLLCTTLLLTAGLANAAPTPFLVSTGVTGNIQVSHSASTVVAKLYDQPTECATFPTSITQGQSAEYTVTPACTASVLRATYSVYKNNSATKPDARCMLEFTRTNDGKSFIMNNDLETGGGAYCAISGNDVDIWDQLAPASS